MLNRAMLTTFMYLIITGCSTSYGPMGMNGGYEDERINSTTYYLVFKAASLGMGGGVVGYEKIEAFWNKRAAELCGSEDYYSDIEKKSELNTGHTDNLMGTPAVYGIVYCNNKFVDARKQAPDQNYERYQSVAVERLQYEESSPLWSLLMESRYSELESEIGELLKSYENGEFSESNLAIMLSVFSKVNPVVEEKYTQWKETYPTSFIAHWAEAIYYYNFAWSKIGKGSLDKASAKEKGAFYKYRDLAEKGFEQSLALNSKFCLTSSELILLQNTKKTLLQNELQTTFDKAKYACSSSIELYLAYLVSLMDQGGSALEKMNAFVEKAKLENTAFNQLEAMILVKEANDLIQDRLFEQALKKSQKALEKMPVSLVFRQLGLIQENLNNYVEAVESYQTAITLNPYYQIAYLDLYRVLSKQGDYLGALSSLTKLTALNNQVPEVYAQMGKMFYDIRRYEEAIISYKKALLLEPDSGFYQHRIRMAEFQLEARKINSNENTVKTSI